MELNYEMKRRFLAGEIAFRNVSDLSKDERNIFFDFLQKECGPRRPSGGGTHYHYNTGDEKWKATAKTHISNRKGGYKDILLISTFFSPNLLYEIF